MLKGKYICIHFHLSSIFQIIAWLTIELSQQCTACIFFICVKKYSEVNEYIQVQALLHRLFVSKYSELPKKNFKRQTRNNLEIMHFKYLLKWKSMLQNSIFVFSPLKQREKNPECNPVSIQLDLGDLYVIARNLEFCWFFVVRGLH